jgi:hypothetical protein
MDDDRNASQSGFSGDEHLKERLKDLESRIKNDVETQLLGPKFELLEITQKVSRIDESFAGMLARVGALEQRMIILNKRTTPARMNWIYFVTLLSIVIFVAALVGRGWAQTPAVSIDFNVGDIIGGILVGVAALFAASSYSSIAKAGSQS